MVRRELSDNYCLYTPKYDTLDACYDWARDTLNKHAGDQREYVYTRCALGAALHAAGTTAPPPSASARSAALGGRQTLHASEAHAPRSGTHFLGDGPQYVMGCKGSREMG